MSHAICCTNFRKGIFPLSFAFQNSRSNRISFALISHLLQLQHFGAAPEKHWRSPPQEWHRDGRWSYGVCCLCGHFSTSGVARFDRLMAHLVRHLGETEWPNSQRNTKKRTSCGLWNSGIQQADLSRVCDFFNARYTKNINNYYGISRFVMSTKNKWKRRWYVDLENVLNTLHFWGT